MASNQTSTNTCPRNVTYLTPDERLIFMIIFTILFILSMSGNVAAIVVTTRRKHRFVHKASIISLSLSDIIMTAAYCTNNIETFSHPMINWTLGEFMCSFIPFAQIFGLMTNLASMVVIAVDRYVNVVKVLAHRWNPHPVWCMLWFATIWIICMGISYPIYPMFGVHLLRVYYNLPVTHDYELYPFCVTAVKDQLQVYYICIAALVFTTLWGTTIYLNYSIAHMVWSHRMPGLMAQQAEHTVYSVETSMTQLSGSAPLGSPSCANKPQRKVHITGQQQRHTRVAIARRIRTFKIILFSILVFTVCRLPFWVFNTLRLSWTVNQKTDWLLLYSFNALALLNCAINPFIYAFLGSTMRTMSKVYHLARHCRRNICCWYCSAPEFDDFGKDNPFHPEANRN